MVSKPETHLLMDKNSDLILLRMPLAENWRRRGKFEEVAFIFPNAPTIPISAVGLHNMPI